MKWEKKGLIFTPPKGLFWWKSHAMAPSPILLNREVIRVYVGALDGNGISRIAYVDLSADNPKKVLRFSREPVLDIGEAGTFDENGVFPASIYRFKDRILLYYTGFQLGQKVRYFMFGGLAVSTDNGDTFKRIKRVPVTDRSDEGLYFRGGPTVIYDNNVFRCYYSAGSEWIKVGGKLRPTYNIFYVESNDGITFSSTGTMCLSYDSKKEHGLGRPQIIKDNGVYKLFYTRRMLNMRYLSGYAESRDGIKWVRKDKELALNPSKSGWDSKMVYFPNVIKVKDKWFIFYNGNDYGEVGFGYAELLSW